MKTNYLHLVIAATIVIIFSFGLTSSTAKRQVTNGAAIDRTPSNRHSTQVSWFAIENFLLPAASADLAITKTGPNSAAPDTNVTYIIQVANNGPDSAAEAAWNDTLPANTTFVSLSSPPPGWNCNTPSPGFGGNVNCSNPNFAVSGGVTFTLVVHIAPATPQGTVITNTATVNSSTADSNGDNNSYAAAIFVQTNNADIAVGKSGPDTAAPDTDMTYTIQVANNGPDTAANAMLNDPLPAGTLFVSLSTPPPGWNCTTPLVGSGGTINCTNPSFAVTNGVTFTVVVHVDPQTPTGTFLTNIATVSTNPSDTNSENNSASATTLVPGTSADIGVTKSASADDVFAGANVTYTIVVTNAGPDVANNATMNDALPGNMTFVSLSSPPGWSCTPPSVGTNGTVSCLKTSLAVSAIETFTLVGNVPSGTPDGTTYQNTAVVGSSTQDPNPDNNQFGALTTVVSCFTDPYVTSNADSGPGSLRQAIQDACANSTIRFDASLAGPITLTSGSLVIDKNLTIEGPGATVLTVARSNAAASFSVFQVDSGVTATISGLTVSGGLSTNGGGINNLGTLNLVSSRVSGNTALNGGGVASTGALNVSTSTINGNTVSGGGGKGGGIYSTGTATVTDSTISGNTTSTLTGRLGGGIYVSGTFDLTNSTVSGNTSSTGSGIYVLTGATLTAKNVTVSDNIAAVSGAGGIYVDSGSTTNLGNTIVANTSGDSDLAGPGSINSLDYNLIESPGSTTISGTIAHNITGADPKLGALAFNGGSTQTHALLSGSPALDAGDNTFITDPPFTGPVFYDQRGAGFARLSDAGSDANTTKTVDIGAFEADPSIEDISDKGTPEDTPLVFSFNVGDSSTPFTSITTGSSNTTLVPNANVQVSGSGSTRTLTITPVANLSGTSTITITLEKIVGGVQQTSTDTFVLTVTSVNDAPVNTVPGSQNVTENGTLTFSAANSNQISIADVDAGSNPVQVTLTATNGTMSLSGTSGLTFTPANTSNDGVNDATLTFSGTIANINTALNGMTLNPTSGFSGPASIQIVTNDQGNTGSGGALSDTDTINITVNDGGTLAFSSTTYTVAEGGGTATITVSRSGGTAGEARVNYATSNGTATAGQDYTSSSGQLIFANGVTSQTFTVAITNDALDEPDETVNLTLSSASGSGALGTPATAVLTITDDDAQPSISIDDMPLNEGNSGITNFVFTVSLSAASGQTVTVNYQTADGTATAPGDYTAIASTSLTFNPGETSKPVTVVVNGDTANEADETFFVNLSGATNATISDNQGLGTILNDDTPGVQFSSPTYSIGEAGSHAAITVTRTGDSSIPVTVNYASSDASGLNTCSQVTGNASQRCDYATVVGILRFAAGENSKDIIVPIIDDVHIEGGEIFTMTLSSPVGGNLGSNTSAVVTITDNDTGAGTNPIDNDAFFIRQLYIDLLGRLPEPGAVNAWLGILNQCSVPTDCDRIAVAAGFLGSLEFQGRGYFVYRHYASLLGRIPLYGEFTPDMALVNGFLSSTDLEANKVAYTNIVMNRPEFKSIYDPTINNPTAFVDKLLEKAGLTSHSQRNAWISGLTNSTLTRAEVVRQFIDSAEVSNKFAKEAFVIMNYFGFLRRTADASYQAWLDLLNQTNNPRVIIGGFINSPEYRLRFGP